MHRVPVIIEDEVEFIAIRTQGAGGHNVQAALNKVSSAIHLRFDIRQSSLPDAMQERLLALQDQRITTEGLLIVRAKCIAARKTQGGSTAAPKRQDRRRCADQPSPHGVRNDSA